MTKSSADKKSRKSIDFAGKSLTCSLLPKKAIDGTRTRDFHLGKVALYQLSHYRASARLGPDLVKLILW